MTTNDNNINTFKNWLKKNGAKFPHLYIENYNKGERGVKTRKNLNSNKNIIYIPKKLIIYVDMGKKTDWGVQLQKYHESVSSPDITYILLFMIKNIDNKEDFFYPYYQTLPKNLNHLPIFWREKDLQFLESSYIRKEVEKRKQSFINDYGILCRACNNFADVCSEDKFMYVRSIIGSRNFGLFIDGTKQSAMVPFADMLNHSENTNTKWYYNSKKHRFVLDSVNKIKSGSEIVDTYGTKCNSKYLLYYGFTLSDDFENRNYIEIRVSQQVKTGSLFLEKNKLISNAYKCYINADFGSNEFSSLLRFLRIANASKEEFESISNHLNNGLTPISKRNEIATLSHLAFYVKKTLESYTKTIEENKKELKKLISYSNATFAVKLVIGEKKILKAISDFCKLSLEILLFNRRISKRKLKNNMNGYIILIKQLNST
jgi:protein-histidine N-methyltransferase